MSYTPISETNVTQATTNVATRGFGTLLCIADHNNFLERFKSYSSLEEVAADFLTTDEAYLAAQAAFSVDPKPREIKIGRRKNQSVLSVQSFANTTLQLTTSSGTYTFNISTSGLTTIADITAALASAINANVSLSAQVTAVATASSVVLNRDTPAIHDFAISNLANIEVVNGAIPEETITDAFAAIQAETTDFYCVACTDRSPNTVSLMASVIATTKNVYTYATNDPDAYTPFSPSSTDYTALIKLGGNKRVVFPVYVQGTEIFKYPEIRIFASKSGYQAGDVIYSNIANLGILPAKTSNGLLLTNAHKANLADRGLSYFENKNGVTVLRRGMAQGAGTTSWADETIGADFIEARINEQVMTLFTNQYSEKVGGSAAGYARIESVIRTVLDSMKTTGTTARLLRKYEVTIPTEDEITSAIRAGRVATIKVAAYLEGALDSAVVNVTLTY